MTREENLELALLEKEEELSMMRIELNNLSNEIEVQRGKIESLQEQISWMNIVEKNEQEAENLLRRAREEADAILKKANDDVETKLNFANADADVILYKAKMFYTGEREKLEREQQWREERIKSFKEESESIIAQTYSIRNLIMNKVDVDEFLQSIGMYNAMRENILQEDSLAGITEALTGLRKSLKTNLSAQKKFKKGHDGMSYYLKGSNASRFFHTGSGAYATMVFDVVSGSIISKVVEDGLEVSLEKLAALKQLCEYHSGLTSYAEYIRLKTEELKLVNDIHNIREEKKEEQRRIKERLADEMKAQKEFERELKRAQKDEDNARRALEAAQLEAAKQKEDKERYAKLQEQIEKLQEALKEAEERNQRTISMAQQTRCGWVYIISHIGSFGEGVYKIGLTRRPDPMIRVYELGDASVPFPFDIHAFIFSEDAPALETALHQAFDKYKVNSVNWRKEYFKVSLEAIKKKVAELGYEVDWEDYAYAPQFRDSMLRK